MAELLQVQNLAKTYKGAGGQPVQAVKGVSFAIRPGEIFSLLGPNGAGKTTTIAMISGLLAPTDGDALIGGHSITRAPQQAKALLGVVPQDIALYTSLSARQNLAFFGRMYGLTGADLNRRIDEVLDFIDLKDRQHDRVETFSGGMKRRVNIGVGLLHRPQLVYMDEPTVGIDPQNRRRILDTVVRLRDEYGMGVLYTTHLMEESQELSDRVGIIDHGEIIALGTVGELTQRVGEADQLMIGLDEQPPTDAALGAVRALAGVAEASYRPAAPASEAEGEPSQGARLTVSAVGGRKLLPTLLQTLNAHGVGVVSVQVREPNLEAVFLHLTGRALRD